MPKAAPFTQKSVESAACPPGRKDLLLFDRELRGFGVRVTAGGSKVFLAQFTVGGTRRRVPVGNFGTLTVREARESARAILGQAAAGKDPVADRREAVNWRRTEAAAAKARASEEAFTFAALVTGWRDARDGDRRASYLDEATATLRRHFAAWLTRPAGSITRAEALDALDHIKVSAGGTAANRSLAYSRAAFGWAVQRGRLAANPMQGVAMPVREKSRDRVLDRAEVGAIWRAAGNLSSPHGPFVRMLMLTLQRRDEVANMRWDYLDDASNPTTWTIPAEIAKNGRAHLVHLGEPARKILTSLPRVSGCQLVFPSERLTALTAFSQMKRALDAQTKAEVDSGWVLHDLRRSGVTQLADMGFAPHVADRLLNHVSGSIRGVAAVYQRSQFLSERKAALEAWGAFVLAAAAEREPAPNVVPLVRSA